MVFVCIRCKALVDVLMFSWGQYSLNIIRVCIKSATVGKARKVYIICLEEHIAYEDIEQNETKMKPWATPDIVAFPKL